MFNFTARPSIATTVASTTSNSTFAFAPSTVSQPFVFGAGGQNLPTTSPFGNLPTNTAGTSVFGTNQPVQVAQLINPFGSNATGTSVKFNPVSGQAPFSTPSTTSNIFGYNNTTTTASPFNATTSTKSNTTGGFFIQPFPANPLNTGGNIFPLPTSVAANPFNVTTSAAPVTTSGFTWPTATTNSFNVNSSNTNAPTGFTFGPQPVAGTNLFSQPLTATPFNTTAPAAIPNPFNNPIPTTTLGFPGFNPIVSTAGTSTIFPLAANSTGSVFPTANHIVTQSTLPSSTANLLNPAGSTTTVSAFNPLLFSGLPVTGTQPTVTSCSSTSLAPVPKQNQNTEQTTSIIQQNFLAASLLDPYANRGRKDFTNIDQIPVPIESAIVSTVSATTNTTSTPIPATLPIQSNLRKASPSRSVVDVNFKLKPVSSSPTSNDDVKPSNQQSKVSTAPVKSTLGGNFTDEEELVLLSRTKMSKLRLSNDVNDASSQSSSIRSLYPVRRLADLENLNNLTSRSSSPTINYERTSHSSSNSRDVSPNPRLTPSVSPKQSSSPIIERKSIDNENQKFRLPILTRDNYFMKPTLSELKSLVNDKGQCILKQFTVGHEEYGSVTFYGQINVAGLNLDKIIEINRHEVIVYPDDDHKPAVGEELNRSARITLLHVYPIDRTTREEITDLERIKATNYSDYLRELTRKFDGEFVNYEMTDGSWTFMVKHFTRYGLNDNQDDFVGES